MDFIGGKAKKRQVKVHGKSKKKTYNSPNNVTEMNITNKPNFRNVQRNDEKEYNDIVEHPFWRFCTSFFIADTKSIIELYNIYQRAINGTVDGVKFAV